MHRIFKNIFKLSFNVFLAVLLYFIISININSGISACDSEPCPPVQECSGENCLTSTDFEFQLTGLIGGSNNQESTSVETINKFVTDIVRVALISIVVIAGSLIVVGGLFMASSGGNTERINRGKTIVTYNTIAVIVALSAYLIVSLVRWILFSEI